MHYTAGHRPSTVAAAAIRANVRNREFRWSVRQFDKPSAISPCLAQAMCARPIEACRFTECGVPTLIAAGVAQEQEPQHLHDAVDPLHVRRLGSGVLASRGLEIGCDN